MVMRKLFALLAFVTLCAAFGASVGRAAEEENKTLQHSMIEAVTKAIKSAGFK